jgi:hypothetical protein
MTWRSTKPFITEPVYQIKRFFSLARTWVPSIIWTYLLDEASSEDEFLTMNRQDSHLQFNPKRNNLTSYAHCQLCLEQAKLAIA